MPEVQSAREVRVRVSAEELEECEALVVRDPETGNVAVFDKECDGVYFAGEWCIVPLPEHRVDMLMDGEVCVWDLISNMPDVRIKVKRRAPAAW